MIRKFLRKFVHSLPYIRRLVGYINTLKEDLPKNFTLPMYQNNTINYRETAKILSLYLDITSSLEALNLYPDNPPHTARNSSPRYFDQVSSNAFFCDAQNLTLLNYVKKLDEILESKQEEIMQV